MNSTQAKMACQLVKMGLRRSQIFICLGYCGFWYSCYCGPIMQCHILRYYYRDRTAFCCWNKKKRVSKRVHLCRDRMEGIPVRESFHQKSMKQSDSCCIRGWRAWATLQRTTSCIGSAKNGQSGASIISEKSSFSSACNDSGVRYKGSEYCPTDTTACKSDGAWWGWERCNVTTLEAIASVIV